MRLFLRAAFFSVLLLVTACNMAEAKLSYSAQKTESGSAYLLVAGTFETSDNIAEFHSAVRASGATVIFFNSGGGNVIKAMELGRAIRVLNMTTVQLRGDECASACSLAFLGGALRFAQPGSIGVHKSSFADTSGMSIEQAVSTVQQLTANVMAYIMEMGVDPALLQLALQYDSNDIRYLSGSEMAQLRVALAVPNGSKDQALPSSQPTAPQAYVPPIVQPPATPSMPPAAEPSRPPPPPMSIPVARNGRVQHPKGMVTLRSAPDSSQPLATIRNGTNVTIIGDTPKWFQVNVNGKVGYLHHSWIWVAQYEAAPYGRAFVQVKSFDNWDETNFYIQKSRFPLVAYLATNGWFAITLDRTFSDSQLAARLTEELKKEGAIPDDAMATYGNAYVRKVCCSQESATAR